MEHTLHTRVPCSQTQNIRHKKKAKSGFNFNSNKLDYSTILGVGAKVRHSVYVERGNERQTQKR
jgi:hypothetical protein